MHSAPFSRKVRQLHLKVEEWHRLKASGASFTKLRKMGVEILCLLRKVPLNVVSLTARKAMASILLFCGLSFHSLGQSFAPPVENPFGFQVDTTNYVGGLCPADLDNDGDFDLLIGGFFGTIDYVENSGTAENPVFEPAQTNAFGLTSTNYYAFITTADLDNDGDLDIIAGEYGGNHIYLKNIGTADTPFFSAPITNGLGLSTGSYISMPEFTDLDNDGDFDIISGEAGGLIYFENQGTVELPGFSAPLNNPFGLAPNPIYFSHPTTGDLDSDGDFDMLIGETGGNFRYIQNLANANAPLFDSGQLNPFGITGGVSAVVLPEFVDLDSDGDLDILATTDGGSLWYYENLEISAGIAEFEKTFSVSPNPFLTLIEVQTNDPLKEVTIFDVQGRLVFSLFEPASTTIDLSHLNSGTYFIAINGASTHHRIVKR